MELLTQWKAQVNHENAAGEICDAASRCISIFKPLAQSIWFEMHVNFGRGDTEQVQRLINSKVDLTVGDYDCRTAIHVVILTYDLLGVKMNFYI